MLSISNVPSSGQLSRPNRPSQPHFANDDTAPGKSGLSGADGQRQTSDGSASATASPPASVGNPAQLSPEAMQAKAAIAEAAILMARSDADVAIPDEDGVADARAAAEAARTEAEQQGIIEKIAVASGAIGEAASGRAGAPNREQTETRAETARATQSYGEGAEALSPPRTAVYDRAA